MCGRYFFEESVQSVAQIVPRNFVEFGAATLTRKSIIGNHIHVLATVGWHWQAK